MRLGKHIGPLLTIERSLEVHPAGFLRDGLSIVFLHIFCPDPSPTLYSGGREARASPFSEFVPNEFPRQLFHIEFLKSSLPDRQFGRPLAVPAPLGSVLRTRFPGTALA